MSFLSGFATSLNFLSWENENLVKNNSIDNFPESKEEILLCLRECFNKYGMIKCEAYKKYKSAHISISMGKDEDKIMQKSYTNFEITPKILEDNFNQISSYILEKKKTINYLKEGRDLKEINKDILKINSMRENSDSWFSLPDELIIFKGLSKEKIEKRLKTILMMKINGYYHTMINCHEVLPWSSYEKYSIAFNYSQLLKFNSENYEDIVYEEEYNYDTLKSEVNKIVKYIEDELNKSREQEKISIKSSDSEGIMKELKEILKLNLPISINEAYEYESQSDNGFIQLSKEDNKIYLVKNKNPYWDLYTLKEDGEVLELEKLKEYLYEIADLTNGDDKKTKDTLDWLND